jgi:hypothetical protein
VIRRLVPVVVALAFAPGASGSVPNPCTLLTNAEVTKALGSKVESREIVDFGGRGRTCKWTGVSLSASAYYQHHRTLTVTATTITGARFEQGARQTRGAVRVAGVGAAAYRYGNGNVTFLSFWQRGRALTIVASLVTDPFRAERIAATAALNRL